MNGASGFSGVSGSITSMVDTSADNINQALAAQQQGKQWNKEHQLALDKWELERLMKMRQMAFEDEERERRRQIMRAWAGYRRGPSPGTTVRADVAGSLIVPQSQ